MIKRLILLLGVAGIAQAGDSLEEVEVVKSEFVVLPSGVTVAEVVQPVSHFTQDDIKDPQAARTALKKALKDLSPEDKGQIMWSWQEVDPLIIVAAMRGKDFDGNLAKLTERLETFQALLLAKKLNKNIRLYKL